MGGKGKGKGGKGGLYELDLMNQWGGSPAPEAWDQSWDQGWDQWDQEGAYLRSLGCIDAVEKKTEDFYENMFTAEPSAILEQWLQDGAPDQLAVAALIADHRL